MSRAPCQTGNTLTRLLQGPTWPTRSWVRTWRRSATAFHSWAFVFRRSVPTATRLDSTDTCPCHSATLSSGAGHVYQCTADCQCPHTAQTEGEKERERYRERERDEMEGGRERERERKIERETEKGRERGRVREFLCICVCEV